MEMRNESMTYRVFVDGQEGTTGLEIRQRLAERKDVEILTIDPDKRKNIGERKKLLNEADIVFLCLPDAAAREAVQLIVNPRTRVIDPSTAHRIHPDWAYGLPELDVELRNRILESARVTNPGCHATGFAAIAYPLVKAGILPRDYPLTCQSITGYSGAGKKMIETYEGPDRDQSLVSPRGYALGLSHKHLPEMQYVSGLTYAPLFTPVIGDYYRGMAVYVPFLSRKLNKRINAREMQEFFSACYIHETFVSVAPFDEAGSGMNGFFDPQALNHTNHLKIHIFGHHDQILAVSCLDNLGKGASGAAIQNMNIMLGLPETTGLL